MRLRDLADLLQRELALHVLLQELRERGDAGAIASRAYAELVRD